MLPVLFHIGPVSVYTYGFCVAAGVLLAVFLMRRQSVSQGWTPDEVMDAVLYFTLTSFIGARIFYVVQHWDFYAENPAEIIMFWEGGVVFYGGVIAGLLFLWGYSRHKKWPVLKLFDFFAPYIALAHGFGRIGCFLNGCCYGSKFFSPWSVRYPFLPFPVHPVQLYEAAANFAAFFILYAIHARKKYHGETSLAYFLIYGSIRFLFENFRGDNAPFGAGLTLPQVVSLAVLTGSAAVYFLCFRKKA